MKRFYFFILLLVFAPRLFSQSNDYTYEINNEHFTKARALMCGEDPISVSTGHSAPLIYDFNKDGVKDLLVGEFGNETYIDNNCKTGFVQGRCRIYINKGTSEKPRYDEFQWLMADNVPAAVPVTCCISFVPRIADINADGNDDIFSGSFVGHVYYFQGQDKMKYNQAKILTDKYGDTLKLPHAMSVDPIDWDNNGCIDLLITSRTDGCYVIINSGTQYDYKFEKPVQVALEKHKDIFVPSYLSPQDWDEDGLFDLVGGTEWGDIVYYKNIGTKAEPLFASPITLYDNPTQTGYKKEVTPLGGRVKTWVCDFNNDGKLEILAGDVTNIRYKVRDLSTKEEMKKKQLELKLQKLSQIIQERNLTRNDINNPLTKKEIKNYASLRQDSKKIVKQISEMDNYVNKGSFGYVWVFERK